MCRRIALVAVIVFWGFAGSAAASPVVHEITFDPDDGNQPSVIGFLTVDDSQLIPNNQISCPSECLDLNIAFTNGVTAVFDLGDIFENIFADTDGAGAIASMNVLMADSNTPGGTDAELVMNSNGTYDFTVSLPSLVSAGLTSSTGSYSIALAPEPAISALGVLWLFGLLARRRSR